MLINGTNGTAGSAVAGAIRDAAQATGASFDYLLATARVESGLNPNAAAATSSAGGLFQFVNQTWLATLKQAGPGLGYGRYADAIVQTPSGHFDVPDPAMRREILALRSNAGANAAMAGAFTNGNAARLADKLGRPATDGELYIAHFLGSSGAAKLISTAANSPNADATAIFPNAAAANRSIFYNKSGSARSVSEVYGTLVGRYNVALAGAANAVAAAQPAPTGLFASQTAVALATNTAATASAPIAARPQPMFHGLFSTGPRSPVSDVVRDLWATRPQVAAALTGAAAATPVNAAGEGQLDLFRDLPPNARALFTTRS